MLGFLDVGMLGFLDICGKIRGAPGGRYLLDILGQKVFQKAQNDLVGLWRHTR
jgi:hypothetical protein